MNLRKIVFIFIVGFIFSSNSLAMNDLDQNESNLKQACLENNLLEVQRLIKLGTSVEIKNSKKNSLLHIIT